VNFRLTYDGAMLKAVTGNNKRKEEKHQIRRAFHVQLANLWNNTELLRDQMGALETEQLGDQQIQRSSLLNKALKNYKRGDFVCLPIIRSDMHLVCDLDILFLRPEQPGQIIKSGGDLDNRLKTLFDALRIPNNENEIKGFKPEAFEMPFLCLLENDSLITGFRITTDRLLEAATKPALPADEVPRPEDVITVERCWENHPPSFVRLIINVKIKATKLTMENMGYFSHF